MVRIFLVLVCLGVFYVGNSQDIKSGRKARKELRRNEKILNYSAFGASIESKRFLLEIDNIQSHTNNKKKMNPMLNFIKIDSSSCVWRSESNDIPTDLMKTVSKVEGSIDDWKLEKDIKHLGYFLQFKMFTDNGLFHVTVYFYPDKTFSGTINGVRDTFNFYGRFIKN